MFKRVLVILASRWLSGSAFSQAFVMKSSVLKNNGTIAEAQVFNSFGCTGANISPDLEWSGAPKGTKAFALTMFDPDAPTGSGWWHWVVFNIPAGTTKLAAGAGSTNSAALPAGSIQGRTDFGKPGYGGPCPPPGKPHRYIFKLYALKDMLQIEEGASAAMVSFSLNHNKLAETVLTAKYGRK